MSDNIKEKVMERYGKIALTGNSDYSRMLGKCNAREFVQSEGKPNRSDDMDFRSDDMDFRSDDTNSSQIMIFL